MKIGIFHGYVKWPDGTMHICGYIAHYMKTWRPTDQPNIDYWFLPHPSFARPLWGVQSFVPGKAWSPTVDTWWACCEGSRTILMHGGLSKDTALQPLLIIRVTWPSWPSWDLLHLPRRSWTRRAPSWTWRKRRSERPTAASSRPRRTVTVGLNLGDTCWMLGCHHAITQNQEIIGIHIGYEWYISDDIWWYLMSIS